MFGPILSALLGLTALTSSATAAQFEVSVTSSLAAVRDPRWDKLSANRVHSATGVSVGMGISDSLSAIVGFNTGKTGSMILVPGTDDTSKSRLGFNLATTLTQYRLGARYRWKWLKRLVPTTTISALLGHASIRMDEDINNDGDEVSGHYTAMAGGLEFGGGLEYTLAFLSDEEVRINLGLEAGYTNLLKLSFDHKQRSDVPISLGDLNLGGAFMTLYLGSRF